MENNLEDLLKNNEYESPFEFTHYGAGFGKRFEHSLYDEYLKKVDRGLSIIDNQLTEEEIEDVIETLKISLENGKDFYSNAKLYMKEKMEEYSKLLEDEIKY